MEIELGAMPPQPSSARVPVLGSGQEGAMSGGSTLPPGWGMDGAALHAKETGVHPSCWCVTKDDVKQFRLDVWRAILAGKILPTDRDRFDCTEDRIGPSIHSLVTQYIKPLTREAGCMSWALLHNPSGIQCDLFVTHCWAEGIFEFIDKLLESWPRGTQAAWVCFFANPQNLDIDELVAEPRTSPFRLALDTASHMLVVPNQATSIYGRIWCVYEAYLAMTGKKVILTATPSMGGEIARRVLVLVAWFAGSFLISSVLSQYLGVVVGEPSEEAPSEFFLNQLAFFSQVATLLNLCRNEPSQVISVVAVIGLGITSIIEDWTTITLFLMFNIGSEADRVVHLAWAREQQLLLKDYQGVEMAESSSERDKHNIFREIGNELSAVEQSVQVLQHEGMSTEALRKAHSLKVSIGGAKVRWGSAALLLLWPYWIVSHIWDHIEPDPSGESGVHWFVLAASAASLLLCIVRCTTYEEDEKAFLLASLTKSVLLTSVVARACGDGDLATNTARLFMSLMSLVCASGRGRLLEIPCIGLSISEALAPGCSCSCKNVAAMALVTALGAATAALCSFVFVLP